MRLGFEGSCTLCKDLFCQPLVCQRLVTERSEKLPDVHSIDFPLITRELNRELRRHAEAKVIKTLLRSLDTITYKEVFCLMDRAFVDVE